MNARDLRNREDVAEGGCGVVGLIASEPVRGIHIRTPCQQMHNRGNGKGGGVAAAGLVGADLGIPQDLLPTHSLLCVAYLDPNARPEVEAVLNEAYDIAHQTHLRPRCTPEEAGLELEPPDVHLYLATPKPSAVAAFARAEGLAETPAQAQRDAFVLHTSDRINDGWYASLGEKRAFVMSHGHDLLVVKVVGYAEQAAHYYGLDRIRAHAWIGHQRYPTKGIVWHPGGAHPFVGVHEALVHNGDFANYAAVGSYLKQFGIRPRFLTDTEVSVQLLDLYTRRFGYPLEWAIEALAPTTDLDLERLPPEKKALYERIQICHVHGSPDGPWFFIVIRNPPGEGLQLVGITDTSMLRPQVFALHDGEVKVGLIASERQAVDAALESLHAEDPRILPVADRYWVARGGSHTDGGAFVFRSGPPFRAEDKFGRAVEVRRAPARGSSGAKPHDVVDAALKDAHAGLSELAAAVGSWSPAQLDTFLDAIARASAPANDRLAALTRIHDVPFPMGPHRPAWFRHRLQRSLRTLLEESQREWDRFGAATVWNAQGLAGTVVLDAAQFQPEGPRSAGRALVHLYHAGATRVIAHAFRGQRFAGCGLGPQSDRFRLDLYGNVGDYVASGLDGAHMEVHMSGQDQVAQILKRGTLVIHGDVGQAFGYGAKGGEVFVRGSAAGRPLINATGRPRVVINGTCLDYLAESFMAGDPHNGGGFCILNGLTYDEAGELVELPEPYPGGNLFSLASGGAMYIRDPRQTVNDGQLNGGRLAELTQPDWDLILPLLQRNEAHFGIPIERLLTVDGQRRRPEEVYRKVVPAKVRALARMAHT